MFWSSYQKLYCCYTIKANCVICILQLFQILNSTLLYDSKKYTNYNDNAENDWKYYNLLNYCLPIIVFNEFGDRVKLWITLNEPWVVSIQGHSKGDMAPGMKGPGILEYKVAHNLIRSHAKAYRVYQNEFAETQQGIVFTSI